MISKTLKAELEKELNTGIITATAEAQIKIAKAIYCWEELAEAPGEL